MGWYDYLLHPFKWALSYVLGGIHNLLTTIGFSAGPGNTWIYTIIVLTVFVNLCILPLYIKQIKSARGMSVIQPKMTEIREKYKGRNDAVSRQQMQQETMALYSEYGVNPMASCLPMLVQLPIMMALYRLLWQVPEIAAHPASAVGALNAQMAKQIEETSFFGIYLSETFTHNNDPSTARILIITLVIFYAGLMFAQMFLNYRFNLALKGNDQQVRMMKVMTFGMPFMVGWFGFIVQLGLLIYLVVTMIFNFVRQVFTIYFLPTPGAKAHDWMLERHKHKYEAFKKAQMAQYQAKLDELALTNEDIAKAQKIAVKARQSSGEEFDLEAAFAQKEHGEKLLSGYRLYESTQATLHKKAQDLELEEKPRVKKEPGFFGRMMQNAQQQNASIQSGNRNQKAQPRRISRSERENKGKGSRKARKSRGQQK